MNTNKVWAWVVDWFAVWIAVFSFEVLAAVAVDPQLNIDQDAWQALLRAVLIATGATGLWQAITYVRRKGSVVPDFVQEQLPDNPPIGMGGSNGFVGEDRETRAEDGGPGAS